LGYLIGVQTALPLAIKGEHMNYLGIAESDLIQQGSYHTAKEIQTQAEVWLKTLDIIQSKQDEIQHFFAHLHANKITQVLCMGAGSSEYIGNVASQSLNKQGKFKFTSVSSTEILLDPKAYIQTKESMVFVSFARSGNSPESVGALNVVNQVASNPYHIIITCNSEGDLYRAASRQKNSLILLLPEETNDQGFAMTASFTNMLLAMTLCFEMDQFDQLYPQVKAMASHTQHNLANYLDVIDGIMQTFDSQRIIYLGSLANRLLAQECSLKILELTRGEVATLFDSPLGFRHGPKSFINDQTLVVVFLHEDAFVQRYELDLIRELNPSSKSHQLLVITTEPVELEADHHISLNVLAEMHPLLLSVMRLVIAQVIAFKCSYHKGFTVDNPFPSGEVNRVVKGVTIYPHHD
jgi:tagatose-6-phosphate ketose/aldose isomerase